MPQTIQDGQPFPLPCPKCSEEAGTPFSASTKLEGGRISVELRCSKCHHEWRYDMPVTTDRKRDSGIHRIVKP